ncbi:MAG: guanylate kinase [Salibacteraceae bacterium]
MTASSRKEKAIIFSAPSGAGKTTIVRALLQTDLPLAFSISATSREPRGNEINGVDYYFLGINGFKKMIDQDALIEWEEVYEDQFYGTLKSEVERIWRDGKAVVFDVDVYGAIELKKIFGDKALAIFIMPPSINSLEERLKARNTENEDKIKLRLAKSAQELEQRESFDAIVVNDKLGEAIKQSTQLVTDYLNS